MLHKYHAQHTEVCVSDPNYPRIRICMFQKGRIRIWKIYPVQRNHATQKLVKSACILTIITLFKIKQISMFDTALVIPRDCYIGNLKWVFSLYFNKYHGFLMEITSLPPPRPKIKLDFFSIAKKLHF